MTMKRMPAFIILTVVTLVSAALLALTDAVTRGPIQEAAIAEANNARKAVLPAAEVFSQVEAPEALDSLYEGYVAEEKVGNTASITVQGYASPIEVTVGIGIDGKLAGIQVGGSGFAETAGLGSLAQEPTFTDQFAGKSVPVSFDDVDAISGATVTSRAVLSAVNTVAHAVGLSDEEPAVDTETGATP